VESQPLAGPSGFLAGNYNLAAKTHRFPIRFKIKFIARRLKIGI
jgi:hypothetical protein